MVSSGSKQPPDIYALAAELQAQVNALAAKGNDTGPVAAQGTLQTDRRFRRDLFKRLIGRLEKPFVSIVIPVYNKVTYTLDCLESLSRQTSKYSFEIIVVDNASADETAQLVGSIPGICYIRNQTNKGFVDGCNGGVKHARGKIIVLLNNDTQVLGGWLDGLVNRLVNDDSIGLVGSKLIYPDGRLQEAGSIIFKDASGHNFGKSQKADAFEYNYARDVDYCSGASIAFYRRDFNKLGGFDRRYAPAYYEDTDLAMSMRHRLKKRVVYEPLSVLIHNEGGTAGTDLGSGFKQYQAVNQQKFLKKWRRELAKYHYTPTSGPASLQIASRYGKQKHILIVDGIVPEHNRDSGSLRMTELIKAAQRLGYAVTFFPDNRVATMPYTAELQARGVEVVYGGITPKDFHQEHRGMYDVVLLSRPLSAIWHLNYCQAYQPQAKLIYDTVDLHFLRVGRQAEVENKPALKRQAALWEELEYYLMDNTDSTLVVSREEQKFLRQDRPKIPIFVVSNINPAPTDIKKAPGYNQRDGLLFIGSYNHTPNVDAAKWFVKQVLPLVKKQLPDVSLDLLGSNPPSATKALASRNIRVPGFIDDIGPRFAKARVFICPLRYGAGVKGKVSQALASGLPIVSTSVGIEGMALRDGNDCLVADTAEDFAAKVVSLYNDKVLWGKIRENSLKTYQDNFSEQAGQSALKRALGG